MNYIYICSIGVALTALLFFLTRKYWAVIKKVDVLQHPKQPVGEAYQMFDQEKRGLYLNHLNRVMESSKPFLQRDYHIRDLSFETEIPMHHLSFLINTEFNLHFQDYINYHRVEFLKTNFHDPNWQFLTLEGMAWEAGFKSRTTFFRAFVKFTGHSPSSYFSVNKKRKLKSV